MQALVSSFRVLGSSFGSIFISYYYYFLNSHVGNEESDKVRGNEIEDRVLDMNFGDNLSVFEVQDVVRCHNLVK